MKYMMQYKLLATALMLALGIPALAAEQGNLGTNSQSRFTISIAIQPSLEIKTNTDIALTIADRTVDTEYSQAFCVQGHTPSKYTIVATGSAQLSDAFLLRNAEGETLPYGVSYRGRVGQSAFDPLTPGESSDVYDVLPRNQLCEDGTAFKVTFAAEDLNNAGSGLYSGSLTLLVSPV